MNGLRFKGFKSHWSREVDRSQAEKHGREANRIFSEDHDRYMRGEIELEDVGGPTGSGCQLI